VTVKEQLGDPTGIVVACVLGAIGGVLADARQQPLWVALVIGGSIAVLVLVVKVIIGVWLDRAPRRELTPGPDPEVPFLRLANDSVSAIRGTALILHAARVDELVVRASAVEHAVYQATKTSNSLNSAAAKDALDEAMHAAVQGLQKAAAELRGAADPPIDRLIQDLEHVRYELEKKEELALRSS
jgi:hypothetical protein